MSRPITLLTAHLVACPHCERVNPKRTESGFCLPCRNTGHNARLMGVAELRWSAEYGGHHAMVRDVVRARYARLAAALEAP